MAKGSRTHHITRQDIINLMNRPDNEVLRTLVRTQYGFKRFLKGQDYFLFSKKLDYEVFENLTEVASRACNFRYYKEEHKEFVSLMAECEEFVFTHSMQVMNEWMDGQRLISNMPLFLKHYAIILRTLLRDECPCCDQITNFAFPVLQNVWNVMKGWKKKLPEDIVEEYEKLKKCVDRQEERAATVCFAEDNSGIESFRKLSIIPAEDDVINVRVEGLPKNVIDRPYESTDHYLSVFFRLTREDMLRSFRSCIKIVDNPNDAFKYGCNLYESVTVSGPPKFTVDGVTYKIKITTTKPVEWSKKEVLLPGSMVCLTSNNFSTVIFAVIREVKAGTGKQTTATAKIVLTNLKNMLEENVSYCMIEPDAYFECYKHVLSAIKLLKEENFPLSDFLVFFEFENSIPKYLHETTEYCLYETIPREEFYKLFLPDEINSISNRSVPSAVLEEFPPSKVFDPLSLEKWPTALDLGLDEQQYEAYKMALTTKVAVIQGPPGTGKTFIGVKVVQALLMNGPSSPIVICCLTNHALDQFLEIIYKFNKNVVRLGSQSQSTILEPIFLHNLMFAYKDFKRNFKFQNFDTDGLAKRSLDHLRNFVPIILNSTIDAEYDGNFEALKSVSHEISSLFSSFDSCQKNFIEDSALNEIIDSDIKQQLRKKTSTESKTLKTSTMEWLNCTSSHELLEKAKKKFAEYDVKGVEIPRETKSKNENGVKGKNVFPKAKLKTVNEEKEENVLQDAKPINVWGLSLESRFQYFYVWRKNTLTVLQKQIDEAKEEYARAFEEFAGNKPDAVKAEILQHARVIGVTTTGAGKFRSLLESLLVGPKILIIEEAAEVLESHTIASLLPSIEHLILIGDHKQLRPLPHDHELAETFQLKISMFERLFSNGCPSATLSSQHRMRPCFANLLVNEELYPDLTSNENVYKYPEIIGIKSSMFFFNHCNPEGGMSSSTSVCNKFEAAMVVSFARYLCQQGYQTDKISILATYSAQVPLIQEFLAEENLEIYVTTVDNYQGEENDIIIVSFVRNNDMKIIGFLKENNRVCVALSRARQGMFCFGNFTQYAEKSPLWKDIVERLEAQNAIGSSLPLKCSQHEKEMLVDSPEQVLIASKSGCSEKCGFELACGHHCQRKCHSDDRDHLAYKCPLPCEKLIGENKKCPRLCFQRCKRDKTQDVFLDCGHPARRKADSTFAICLQEVQKCLPCMHVDTVPCSLSLSKHFCKALVPVFLPCGHTKNVECYRKNYTKKIKCNEEKTVTGPCGHGVVIPCSFDYYDERDLLPYCKSSCGSLLNCGHACTGLCSWCMDFGIHAICREPCSIILNCGHRCQGLCHSPCPPCNEKCTLSCCHVKESAICQSADCPVPPEGLCLHVLKTEQCINKCNRPCKECTQPCLVQCRHSQCQKKCSACSADPCEKKCNLTLMCGHPCSGFCGDVCPTPCVWCNPPDTPDIDLKTCMFIQLLDCQHVVESSSMKEHIQDCCDSFIWPNCPVCSQPIFSSLNYKNLLKETHDGVLQLSDEDELDRVKHLKYSLFGVENSVIPAEFSKVIRRIDNILHGDLPSSGTLFVLKHCLTALRDLMLIKEGIYDISDRSAENRFETLLMWISNHLEQASYQQLHELTKAISDLKIFCA